MSPAEEYQAKRLEVETLLRQYAPKQTQEELIAALWPTISLGATSTEDIHIPLGASKFGGAPDTPVGFEWPTYQGRPLGFLAQINLEEVKPYDIRDLLPPQGILAFFLCFDENNPVWGEARQRDGWRVYFYPPVELQRQEIPDESHWFVPLLTQRVQASVTWSLASAHLDLMGWEEEEWSEFQWGFLETMRHQMLGEARSPQLCPFTIAVNGSDGINGYPLYDLNQRIVDTIGDWELLLQLDSEVDGFFEDIHGMGWLYFMIRREDLTKGDFSKAWFNQQNT